MKLEDAIAQFVDMVKVGSQALDRIAVIQLRGRQKDEFEELIGNIVACAEKLTPLAKPSSRQCS